MYKIPHYYSTTLEVNESTEGESIEEKMERVINNNEPIEDGAPIIYTERKDGVQAEYNIRTDRFDLAVDATDIISRDKIAKRQSRIDLRESEKLNKDVKPNTNEGTIGEP